MTQRLLTLYRCEGPVCPSYPAEAVLCVRPEILAPQVCPESEEEITFEFSYLEASVVYQCKKGCEWEVQIQYDDTLLVENYTLVAGDVQGLSCKGCLGKYADERAGNEVYVYVNGDDRKILVTQHGCEYDIGPA